MTHDLKGAPVASTNSFDAHGTLEVGDQSYEIYRLASVEGSELPAPAAHHAESGVGDTGVDAENNHPPAFCGAGRMPPEFRGKEVLG